MGQGNRVVPGRTGDITTGMGIVSPFILATHSHDNKT